jgi:hypothetical protein
MSRCPFCGHVLSAHAVADGQKTAPSPGDYTVCIECVNVLLITRRLSVRKLSSREYSELRRGPQWRHVSRLIRTILEVKKAHPPNLT